MVKGRVCQAGQKKTLDLFQRERETKWGCELIVIVEILEMNNCRKHSPLPGLIEGKGGSGGCSRVLSKGHMISTGTIKRVSGVESGWRPLPEMCLEGQRKEEMLLLLPYPCI